VSRALSLPHEHGGYLTIAGAAFAGVALAHARAPALAVSAVVTAAFFARAPVEQLVRRRGAPLDGAAVVVLTGIVLASALALADAWASITLAVAAAIVAGSALARRARSHRATWFEALGMAALGASGGLAARAGGADLRVAFVLALVVGVHTCLAVPLVRSEVRPRERMRARGASIVALGLVVAAALLLVLVGSGRCSIALLPRALHAATRSLLPPAKARPNVVGVRESIMLAVVVLALAGTAR
jgi:hypothetical protein